MAASLTLQAFRSKHTNTLDIQINYVSRQFLLATGNTPGCYLNSLKVAGSRMSRMDGNGEDRLPLKVD